MGQEFDRHFEDFRQKPKHEKGGLVRLAGKFLLDHEAEVVNLIKHEGELAAAKSPEHKVIGIEKANGGIEVKVSDHNLALHIGKRLVHAYKGEHQYKFLKGEKFIVVDWRRD